MSDAPFPDEQQDDSPRINGVPMVQIPVSLFEVLSACYYGGGQNHWEKKGVMAPGAKNRTFEERQPPILDDDDEDVGGDRLANPSQPVMIPVAPPGLVPQGAALAEFMSRIRPAPAVSPSKPTE